MTEGEEMRPLHILLVDDDPFILTGIGKDLEGEGYLVTPANSGEQALERIEENHFDLVITDLVMDRIDGIQVLKAVKTASPDTMVLILTGYGDMGSAIEALRLSADDGEQTARLVRAALILDRRLQGHVAQVKEQQDQLRGQACIPYPVSTPHRLAPQRTGDQREESKRSADGGAGRSHHVRQPYLPDDAYTG